MKKFILLLFLSAFIKIQAFALYATVSGPSTVCPFTKGHVYDIRIYSNVGIPINGYTFDMLPPVGLYRGTVLEGFPTFEKFPNSNLTKIKVNFGEPGDLEIRFWVQGITVFSRTFVIIPVKVEYPGVVEPVIPDSYACAGAAKVVSVNNLVEGACFHHSVEWSIPAGWSISQQSGPNYSLSVPANTAPGNYTVGTRGVYTDRNNATTPWVNKTIRVGAPTAPVIIAPSQADQHWVSVSANSIAGMNYNWSVTNGQILSGNGTSSIRVQASCNLSFRNMAVNLTVSNDCGSTVAATKQIQIVCEGYDPEKIISHAAGQIELNLLELAEGELSTSEVSLHDFNGTPVYNKKVTIEKLIIPTSSYPSGIYYLKINSGNKVIQKRIFINYKQ
ncbi:T9SS type A sorting domain-containing protein [Anditalea andensis]|uniref:Uncharacterized protein n=1 Tax=Anditalea andensis TaxID=1048983 RepID=A0A074KVC7_9BACT|nr:T9SS type A sorting domain-containing protein [Anditalea andensis]KEO72889.1 hypothetical protein EL17_14790 [Anditalea andensis]